MGPIERERISALAGMTRDERTRFIDRHVSAGTCYLCGQAIFDGAQIHALTGAHWACAEELRGSVATEAAGARPSPAPVRYRARAAGGHLIHLVDGATGVALCGHAPRDTARRVRPRGRWIKQASFPSWYLDCARCALAGAPNPGRQEGAPPPGDALPRQAPDLAGPPVAAAVPARRGPCSDRDLE